MPKPNKDEIKHHLMELMLVQEEYMQQPHHSEDELINLGWVEALQWALSCKQDFTNYDQRYYPEAEPRMIIQAQKKRTFEFNYKSMPSIDEAIDDYNKVVSIEDEIEELVNENKKF